MDEIICIEGLPGSGKSNLAQFISLQLHKAHIDNRWFFEFDHDNPIIIPEDHSKMISETTKSWLNYFKKAEGKAIFDGRLLLLNVEFSFKNGKSQEQILSEITGLIHAVNSRPNFTLIFLTTKSTEKLFGNTSKCRNADEWYISSIEHVILGADKSTDKPSKVHAYLDLVNNTMLKIYEKFTCKKMIIDISQLDWAEKYGEVLDFINLENKSNYLDTSPNQYVGKYTSQDCTYSIYEENGVLYCNDHPYLKFKPVEQVLTLVPFAKDQYLIRGHPIMLNFGRNQNQEVVSLYESESFKTKPSPFGQNCIYVKDPPLAPAFQGEN